MAHLRTVGSTVLCFRSATAAGNVPIPTVRKYYRSASTTPHTLLLVIWAIELSQSRNPL